MEAGTVIDWPNFEFHDGEHSDKLCVLLNNPRSYNDPYIFSKTTSNPANKSDKAGCVPNLSLFMIDEGKDVFKRRTWLQFYDLYTFEAKDLLKQKFEKNISVIGQLSNLSVRQVLNCLKASMDVDGHSLKIITDSHKPTHSMAVEQSIVPK